MCPHQLLIADPTPVKDEQTQTPKQREDLNTYRTIITDVENSAASRRVMAEQLVERDTDEAAQLVVELLAFPPESGTPLAMCEAIASVGTAKPGIPDTRLIDPLMTLLGVQPDELSARAIAALATFRDGTVARKLRDIAAAKNQPLPKRLAALSVLSQNTDRRETAAELVTLLESTDASIAERVFEALRPASRTDFGADVEKWKQWWSQKQAMTEVEWLRDRLELSNQQLKQAVRERDRVAQDAQARDQVYLQLFEESLRRIYVLSPPADKPQSLITWLGHDVVAYRLVALRIVRDDINENHKPSDTVHAAVLNCSTHPSPSVRRLALEVIGYLQDPSDAEPMLQLLKSESVDSIRESILRVLGRLNNVSAVGALIEELKEASGSRVGCVREAARSLGMLATHGHTDKDSLSPAIEPLRQRFAEADPDDLRFRSILLGAMADIGNPAFTPDFVDNLSADPDVLLPAIRGIESVGAKEYLDRVSTHLSHKEARVRQRSVEALGTLGSQESHLNALRSRLDPNIEANEGVREAAWTGFTKLMSHMPAATRLAWVDRLDDLPLERQLQYLNNLIEEWSANPQSSMLPDALRKMVDRLQALGRTEERIKRMQQLRRVYEATNDPRARDTTMDLFESMLTAGLFAQAAELIKETATGWDAATREELLELLLDYIGSESNTPGQSQKHEALIAEFQPLDADLLGNGWFERVKSVTSRAAADAPEGSTQDPAP